MKTIYIIVLTSMFLIIGCLPDTSGVDPPHDQFNYPTGIAMTPSEDYLLVANSNFDLTYNAGTLIVLDLQKLDHQSDKFAFTKALDSYGDGTVEFSADRKHVYLMETKQGQSPNSKDLLLWNETIRIGSFVSDLGLSSSGDKALLPVRSDNAILSVDLEKGNKVMSCGQGDDFLCDSVHRIKSNNEYSLPIEPYEVASLEYENTNADGDIESITSLGFSTHLSGGEVSLFSVSEQNAEGSDMGIEPSLMRVVGEVIPGASGVAVNPVRKEIYISGRRNSISYISVMKVLTDSESGSIHNNPYFNQVGTIDLSKDMYAGTDARGIAVTSTGTHGYLVTRSPAALVALDLENRKYVGDVSVAGEPSVVEIYEDDAGTADPDDDNIYAFVLCFLTDQVFIINVSDPKNMYLATVRSTGVGPQAITFDKRRKRAYIANFRESTISILNTEPPFDHLRVSNFVGSDSIDGDLANSIVMIGKPRLPTGHN